MSKRHGETHEHIHKHRRLVSALNRKNSTSQLDLYGRLKKCDGPDWGYRYTCRSPACPRCRDRYIARQRRANQARFLGVPNAELAMVSIVLGATYDIWEAGRILRKGSSDLRNRVNRQRRSSTAWNDFEFVGWVEVDAYDPADLHMLGSDKTAQLEELLSEEPEAIGPIWSPTIHAIVRVPPSLSCSDVRSAFQTQWRGHRQVDVRPFHLDKSASKNVSNIINYANKHECTTGPSGFRSSWDTSWLVTFYDWIHQYSRGFLSLRVSVGPKRNKDKRANVSDVDHSTVPSRLATRPGPVPPDPAEVGAMPIFIFANEVTAEAREEDPAGVPAQLAPLPENSLATNWLILRLSTSQRPLEAPA